MDKPIFYDEVGNVIVGTWRDRKFYPDEGFSGHVFDANRKYIGDSDDRTPIPENYLEELEKSRRGDSALMWLFALIVLLAAIALVTPIVYGMWLYLKGWFSQPQSMKWPWAISWFIAGGVALVISLPIAMLYFFIGWFAVGLVAADGDSGEHLTKCPTCAYGVSIKYSNCPQCGYKFRL